MLACSINCGQGEPMLLGLREEISLFGAKIVSVFIPSYLCWFIGDTSSDIITVDKTLTRAICNNESSTWRTPKLKLSQSI